MSIGWFTDKKVAPSEKEIETLLGKVLLSWNRLIKTLRDKYSLQEELKYCYGKKYGWAYQFRHNGKLIVSLYPNKGYFVAQLIVSRKNLEEAAQLDLHRNAQAAIESATEYTEGKWLFIQVKAKDDLEDVLELVERKNRVHEGYWASGEFSLKRVAG